MEEYRRYPRIMFSATHKAERGRRTYFFDVKATRYNEYYLTIAESKKRFRRDGRYFYERRTIFVYREDFEKFVECLNQTVNYIKTEQKELPRPAQEHFDSADRYRDEDAEKFSDLKFEDLGKEKENKSGEEK